MKCKKMIATLMLSTSILGTLTTMVPTLAAENNQVVATATDQTKQGVNIPDANLKKALNRVLNQDENADITADQLAKIKNLDLSHQGICSLEGLQYCTNIKNLNISNYITENSGEDLNKISDLTPLKALQHLTNVDLRSIPVTDVSPLKNLPINWLLYGWTAVFTPLVEAETNVDGTITLKNPCIGFNGEVLKPKDFKGGVYNEEDNTITWSKENFEKYAETDSDHQGKVLLEFKTEIEIAGKEQGPMASVFLYVIPKVNQEKTQENTEQTIDFHGVGTWAGKDTHFAQLKYNGDHTATLQSGIEMYGCRVHPYFGGVYASILAKDKDGNPLFTKEFKGTDWVQTKEENFNLPENATLTIYHAEGTSGRYETSNDKELKQNPVGNTYYYVVKNGILSQQVNKQEFNFLGLGDYKFAQLDVVNGIANLDSKYTQNGSHCYFKDNVYASLVVNDQRGQEVFRKEYRGDKNTPAGLDQIELKEGYTITIHHEEPTRLQTNDDTNLHKESGKDFHFTFTNGNLVEQ
ncbi:hypothetical protein NXK88_002775 [Enterococcus hirae]|uniref:putative mucin/carbohydrate-binding domain-containing protein n=1 Tax=Enterococcus hirae TaxID=1354 RepID=UPI002073C180|nr:putative mucin/carbohydrate-binding domain-containing protein [Enterococcus hirae]EMF0203492.1 hypothetical protein [Enterococcus hirae]